MSAFALLSLPAVSMFIPIFTSEDGAADRPETSAQLETSERPKAFEGPEGANDTTARITDFEMLDAADNTFSDLIFAATGAAADGPTVTSSTRLLGTARLNKTNFEMSGPALAVIPKPLQVLTGV